jgi:hypothetical protein
LFPGRSGPQAAHDPAGAGTARSPAIAEEASKETEPSQISVEPFAELPALETTVETAEVSKAGGDISEPVSIANDPVKAVPAAKSRPVRARKRLKAIVADTASKAAEVASIREPQAGRASSTPAPKKARVSAGARTRLIQPLDTFEAEVAGVDADVRVLTRQLAEKLRQQNIQLRKLLERFGGE